MLLIFSFFGNFLVFLVGVKRRMEGSLLLRKGFIIFFGMISIWEGFIVLNIRVDELVDDCKCLCRLKLKRYLLCLLMVYCNKYF